MYPRHPSPDCPFGRRVEGGQKEERGKREGDRGGGGGGGVVLSEDPALFSSRHKILFHPQEATHKRKIADLQANYKQQTAALASKMDAEDVKITAQLENTNFIVFIGAIACTHAHTCTLLLGAILFTVLLLPRPGLLSLTFMRLLFTFCTPHL